MRADLHKAVPLLLAIVCYQVVSGQQSLGSGVQKRDAYLCGKELTDTLVMVCGSRGVRGGNSKRSNTGNATGMNRTQ